MKPEFQWMLVEYGNSFRLVVIRGLLWEKYSQEIWKREMTKQGVGS